MQSCKRMAQLAHACIRHAWNQRRCPGRIFLFFSLLFFYCKALEEDIEWENCCTPRLQLLLTPLEYVSSSKRKTKYPDLNVGQLLFLLKESWRHRGWHFQRSLSSRNLKHAGFTARRDSISIKKCHASFYNVSKSRRTQWIQLFCGFSVRYIHNHQCNSNLS